MARFADAVTSTTSSMPDSTAPSTMYWITGLFTKGSLSLGTAFDAGRNRVPRPAAGITALRTRVTNEQLLFRSGSAPRQGSLVQALPRRPVPQLAGVRAAARRVPRGLLDKRKSLSSPPPRPVLRKSHPILPQLARH